MAGRPSTYDREIADEILARIAKGESLRSICKSDPKFPPDSTFRQWVIDDVDGIAARSARAYEHGHDAIAEETLEIADDASNDWMESNDPDNPGYRFNGEHVQRAKLRIDTRLRLLGKWAPKKYGDKIEIDGKVDLGLADAMREARERAAKR